MPETAKKLYYWNTQWSQFLNVTQFNEPYTYFYLSDKDLEIDEDTARLDGEPDADIRDNGGLIVEGDESQDLGSVNLGSNGGDTAATIIGGESQSEESGANVNIDDLTITIQVSAKRWYFFAFPFDIDLSKISFAGQFVWRYYDGAVRAISGSGAWRNVEDGILHAGKGYIFQASVGGTLSINVGRTSIGGADVNVNLDVYASANAADASWNLVGNPFTSFYDLANIGFDSPVTIWNGTSYEALNPMDDDFTLNPYMAFFVQKPDDSDCVGFEAEYRMTYNQANDPVRRHASRARRAARRDAAAAERQLVNLQLTDASGKLTDKTRVVFNEAGSADYEMQRDASKFLSTTVSQLYTLDAANTMYAINERPEGDGTVRLGFFAPEAGTFTITAPRMDCEMEIVDIKLGKVGNLSEGYTFTAEQGTDNDRFILRKTKDLDAVENVETAEEDADATYIGINGINYGSTRPNGVAIRKSANGNAKVLNKN